LNRVLIALTGLIAIAVAIGHARGLADPVPAYYAYHATAGLSFTVLGALILPRRPGHPIGWLSVAIGLSGAVTVLAGSFARYPAMAWVEAWSLPLALGLLAFVFLFFPDGHLPSRGWRVIGWAAAAGLCVSVLALAVAAGRAPWIFVDLDVPLPALAERALRVAVAGLFVVVLSAVAAVGSLAVRWRRATGETRQQVKALTLGASTIPVGIVLDFFFGLPVLWLSLGVAVPAAVAVGILKYRLYDIDLVLNRSLVYATLTVLVVGAYVGLVAAIVPFFGERDGRPPVLATAVVALLFQPARQRVQRAVNRLLYGDRDEPYAVVTRLSSQLAQAADPLTVLPRVTQTVADALQLPYAAIELADEKPVASHGRRVGQPVAFPMTHQGQVVGRMLVSQRSPAAPFTRTEVRLLQDLAAQAGLAAHAVRLTTDLQRSRERLVHSREEERRRLRRELHDGLGPALAGMTMQVGVAREVLPTHPDTVDEALRTLERQMQACVAEVRRVVEDLRPPALDQLGLAAAIRSRVHAFLPPRTSGVQVTVTPEDLGELPAAVEVATYRIATEAITNAVRHSGARRCEVRLTMAETMTIEVRDDGTGLPEGYDPGVGLTSMRDRAEELGGTFTATRQPSGGTVVRAELPLSTP
jgi:signal transduction histidine kinase